ncbi:MAG: 3-hydroxyacyl-ACP dehydratase FabZ family protein [Planctomycetota bacterium]
MRWFWVDRFTEYVAGVRATAEKGVSLSDDFIHDHWEGYPVMPNTLIAEGMAQTSGLLVSELYGFQELVVLAKFTKLEFDGLVLPGQQLTYKAQIGHRKEVGAQASVTATVDGRRQAAAEIFFARLQNDSGPESGLPDRLFDPDDLCHWLHITGVFRVGKREDGSPMKPADYGLPVYG